MHKFKQLRAQIQLVSSSAHYHFILILIVLTLHPCDPSSSYFQSTLHLASQEQTQIFCTCQVC